MQSLISKAASGVASVASRVRARTGSAGAEALDMQPSGAAVGPGGVPCYRGVGGGWSIEHGAMFGMSAIRTWGVDQLNSRLLKECDRRGIDVCCGIWVESAPQDHAGRAAVLDTIQQQVLAFKDWSCIKTWLIGNEVELRGDEAAAFSLLNEACARVKALDPTRFTSVAISDGDDAKFRRFVRAASNVDIATVNAYSGAHLVPVKLKNAGWRRPYMLGEYGPAGHWEVPKAPWGAPLEQSSSDKARTTALAYIYQAWPVRGSEACACVGTFCFFGDFKVEVTPTWYSMQLPGFGPVLDRWAVLQLLWEAHRNGMGSTHAGDLRLAAQTSATFAPFLVRAGLPYIMGIKLTDAQSVATALIDADFPGYADAKAHSYVFPTLVLHPSSEPLLPRLTVHWGWCAEAIVCSHAKSLMPTTAIRPTEACRLQVPEAANHRLYAFVTLEGKTGTLTANICVRAIR